MKITKKIILLLLMSSSYLAAKEYAFIDFIVNNSPHYVQIQTSDLADHNPSILYKQYSAFSQSSNAQRISVGCFPLIIAPKQAASLVDFQVPVYYAKGELIITVFDAQGNTLNILVLQDKDSDVCIVTYDAFSQTKNYKCFMSERRDYNTQLAAIIDDTKISFKVAGEMRRSCDLACRTREAVNSVGDFFKGDVAHFFKDTIYESGLKVAAEKTVEFAKSVPGRLEKLGKLGLKGLKFVATKAYTIADKFVHDPKGSFEDAFKTMLETGKGAFDLAQNLVKHPLDTLQGAGKIIKNTAEMIGDLVQGKFSKVLDFFKEIGFQTLKVMGINYDRMKDEINIVVTNANKLGGEYDAIIEQLHIIQGPINLTQTIIQQIQTFKDTAAKFLKESKLTREQLLEALVVKDLGEYLKGIDSQKKFAVDGIDVIKKLHASILENFDRVQVAPIYQAIIKANETLKNALLHTAYARDAGGKLSDQIFSDESSELLKNTIPANIKSINDHLKQTIDNGSLKASQLSINIFKNIADTLVGEDPITKLLQSGIQKINEGEKNLKAATQDISTKAKELSNAINDLPSNIVKRIKREFDENGIDIVETVIISVATVGAGTVALAATFATYEINDTINYVKRTFKTILEQVAAGLNAITTIIQGLTVVKTPFVASS